MILILMGVVGAGKTTVGTLLAAQLGWDFADADDFHSPENKDKIRHGISLTDADRVPWLMNLRAQIVGWLTENRNGVLACSALKEIYRQELQVNPEVRFVYLKGSAELIESRLSGRKGHFADDKILAGQFADLEEPVDALTISISGSPAEIVLEIRQRLGLG
jgi:gluconokinase